MVAPTTTFRSIKEQLENLPLLPTEPKNPLGNVIPKRARTPDGKGWADYYEKVPPTLVAQYEREAQAYYQKYTRNLNAIHTLTQQTFALLGPHLAQEQYATPIERQCLAALDGAIQQNRITVNLQELPEADFNQSLENLSQRVEAIRTRVIPLHNELHNEALGNLNARIGGLTPHWNVPEYSEITEDLKRLQDNEFKKLLPAASNPNEYSRVRANVRDRIVKINEIAKALAKLQAYHPPLDPAQAVDGQIRAVYEKEKVWEDGKAILLSPFKYIAAFPKNHPFITTAAAVGVVAYGASYIPGTANFFQKASTPETYRPVVNIVKSVFGSVWSFGSGVVKMFWE